MRKLIPFFCILINLQTIAQCFSGNFTYSVNGLYSSDLNVTNGDTVLIAPTATVTGNINVTNSVLVNRGNITNTKIHLKGNWLAFNGRLENCGNITSDSILIDTIGDIHNFGIIDVNYTYIGYRGNFDNWVIHRTEYLEMYKSWYYFNIGHLFVNRKLNMSNSRIRNEFMIHCKNQFLIDSFSNLFNGCTIYVDSLFKNEGNITCTSLTSPKASKIIILEQSINNGGIYNMDICDATSITSGGFDISTGTLTNVTYCQAAISCPDYTLIGITEENLEAENISLYPNPANTEFSISGLNEIGNHSLKIRNLLGQELLFTTETQKIGVPNLQSGIYFAEVYEKAKLIKSLKFIKN